jgi:hypothetical protein
MPSALKGSAGALEKALNEPSVSDLSPSVEHEIMKVGLFGWPTPVWEGSSQRKGTRPQMLQLTQREPQVTKLEALSVL